ncbi:MAG: hypothetical protein P9E24_07355 [Candidatus Competibacter sp.]|nr:hypothetical protein [Candidatus Competibacter sp.]MDG4584767.1 hypothetical protein [Candidatus Competibacter sp.]
MSELELTPAEPAPTQRGLLRQIFRPKDIGFYLMILLSWIGAAYTEADAQSSRWYWHSLIPIFGLICIVTQWRNIEPTAKARALLVGRQILHWGALLLLARLVFIAASQGFMNALDDRQASFLLMLNVTLSTFLAGIYFDWRLCFVAIFLGAGAIFMIMIQNIIPILVYAGIGFIVVYLVWTWLYNHWQARRQAAPPSA